jgi:hypothetical protein
MATGCVMAAGAVVCDRRGVWVKEFADAYRKGEGGVVYREGVACYKDVACYRDKRVIACRRGEEGVRRREEVIASPIKVELRRS